MISFVESIDYTYIHNIKFRVCFLVGVVVVIDLVFYSILLIYFQVTRGKAMLQCARMDSAVSYCQFLKYFFANFFWVMSIELFFKYI